MLVAKMMHVIVSFDVRKMSMTHCGDSFPVTWVHPPLRMCIMLWHDLACPNLGIHGRD